MRWAYSRWLGCAQSACCPATASAQTLADAPSEARAANGSYIWRREHLVDDEALGGLPLRGGDGLAAGDPDPRSAFQRARPTESPEIPLP